MDSMWKRHAPEDDDAEDWDPPVKRTRGPEKAKTCEVCRLKTGKGAATCDCLATF